MTDYTNRTLYPPNWNAKWEQVYQHVKQAGLVDDMRRTIRKATAGTEVPITEMVLRDIARQIFFAAKRGALDQGSALAQAQKSSKFTQ